MAPKTLQFLLSNTHNFFSRRPKRLVNWVLYFKTEVHCLAFTIFSRNFDRVKLTDGPVLEKQKWGINVKTMSSTPHPPFLQGQRKQSIRPCFPQHISPVGPVTSGESDDMCIRMSRGQHVTWHECYTISMLELTSVGRFGQNAREIILLISWLYHLITY